MPPKAAAADSMAAPEATIAVPVSVLVKWGPTAAALIGAFALGGGGGTVAAPAVAGAVTPTLTEEQVRTIVHDEVAAAVPGAVSTAIRTEVPALLAQERTQMVQDLTGLLQLAGALRPPPAKGGQIEAAPEP